MALVIILELFNNFSLQKYNYCTCLQVLANARRMDDSLRSIMQPGAQEQQQQQQRKSSPEVALTRELDPSQNNDDLLTISIGLDLHILYCTGTIR